MSGITALVEETFESSLPTSATKGLSQKVATDKKEAQSRHPVCQCLELGSSASRTVKEMFLVYQPPRLWNL